MKRLFATVLRWMEAGALILLLIASGSPVSFAQAKNVSQNNAYSALRVKAAQGEVRVLVTLKTAFVAEGALDSTRRATQRKTIKEIQTRVHNNLAGHRYTPIADYEVFPVIALKVDADSLDVLANSPEVQSIQEDVPLPPDDLTSDSVIGAPGAWAMGYDGSGWAVVILDTGVQSSHPFLAGKTVAEACFSTTDSSQSSVSVCPNGQSTSGSTPGQAGSGSGVNCSLSSCIHGTHVAGIVAGKNYSGGPGYNGVAPGANLIAIQVFSRFTTTDACGGTAPCILSYGSDELAALQYVFTTLRSSFSIASINMSLGGGLYTSACDSDPLKPAVDNLRSVQIATVIAAGNNGSTNSLSSPGCISSAISVGATDNSDNVASFSNRASFMSVYAPGVGINSSVPTNSFAALSGTSMATPHVAGAWAVMKSGAPAATVSQILAAFQTTGKPITNSGFTKSRIQLDAALSSLVQPVTGVIFYQDANYGGAASGPKAQGDYAVMPADVPNDWMSSLKVPAGWSVDVYSDGNFGGTVCTFTADTSFVGTACNDIMSSFKVHATGPAATPTRTPTRTNTPIGPTLTPTRTNTSVGPTPTRTPTPATVVGVIFYQNINYGGAASATLAKGDYAVLPASVPNDWMSSLRVPAGWIVDAYANGNFGGAVCTYTADTSWVGTACNDVMSSFKIR